MYIKSSEKTTATRFPQLWKECTDFLHIPQDPIKVLVCIDEPFAVNSDNTCQLGIFEMDYHKSTGITNIMYYAP